MVNDKRLSRRRIHELTRSRNGALRDLATAHHEKAKAGVRFWMATA